MKTTSPADRLAAILETMRALAPDDPRTRALELGAWRVAAEAVRIAGKLERVSARLVLCIFVLIAGFGSAIGHAQEPDNYDVRLADLRQREAALVSELAALRAEIEATERALREAQYRQAGYHHIARLPYETRLLPKPSDESETLALIPENSEVKLLGHEGNFFVRVQFGDLEGYISIVDVTTEDLVEMGKVGQQEREEQREAERAAKRAAEEAERAALAERDLKWREIFYRMDPAAREEAVSALSADHRAEFEQWAAAEAELVARAEKQAEEGEAEARTEAERKAALIKKYGRTNGQRIIDHKIWLGMTEEMAQESLGGPEDINRTVTAGLVREQWVYGDTYLYFENGILTSWQD